MLHANNQNCLYKLKAPTGINVTVILHRVILDCSDSLTITIPTLRNNFGELLLKCQRNSRREEQEQNETRQITTFDGEIIIQFASDFEDSAQGFVIEYALVEMLNSSVSFVFFYIFSCISRSVQLADLFYESSKI